MNSIQSRGELNKVMEISSFTVIWLKYQLTTPEEKEMLYRFIITKFITSHSQNGERIKIHSFENYNFGHQLESLRVRVRLDVHWILQKFINLETTICFQNKMSSNSCRQFFTDFIVHVGRIATLDSYVIRITSTSREWT